MAPRRGRPAGSGVVWPSAKTVYALRACAVLADAYPDRWLKSREIANASKVPPRFLSKILGELRTAGILSAKRGYYGGYAFARDPREITLAELVRAIDGYELFAPLSPDRLKPRVAFVDDLRDALSRGARDALGGTSVAALTRSAPDQTGNEIWNPRALTSRTSEGEIVNAFPELATRLETIPLFARCHPGDLRVIARHCELREAASGTALIRAGELGDELFVVLSGSAERGRPGQPVRTFGPGDYFGELALLDPAPRSLDVVTTSECVVGVLSRANFLLVLDAVPGVWPQLLAFLARRIRDAEPRRSSR